MESIKSGFVVGIIQTVIWTPIDKALYLSVLNKNSLLSKENWIKPYHKINNALLSKIISNGLYYPLMNFYNDIFQKQIKNKYHIDLLTSISTGITTGILLNPINLVRYISWNNNNITIKDIFKKSKFIPGLQSIIIRDIIFSIIYISNKNDSFYWNTYIVCIANISSSPFNYIKNIKYTNYDKKITIIEIYKELFNNINQKKSLKHKINFFCNQMCIGYGTIRIAISFSFGQMIYNKIVNQNLF